jgi:hypothetical protein
VIQGSAKAWVTFTTSGGACINLASYNVSSITYNGTGDYSINLTNALTDANWTLSSMNYQSAGNTVCNIGLNTSRTSTSSVVQVMNIQATVRFDPTTNISVAVFR